MTDRSNVVRRTVTAGAVVLAAGFLACRDNPADPATGNLALELSLAEGVSLNNVDLVRVRLSSTGAADIEFTLQSTGANQYEGTRENLAPGTYTVTIRGLAGGEVEFFGETTASVQVGVNAPVNITLTSFVPALDPIPNTTGVNFMATWPRLADAGSYTALASLDPNFQDGTEFSPDSAFFVAQFDKEAAFFTAPDVGTYYVRVRAERAGIETGVAAEETANVFTAEVTAGGAAASSTISAPDEKELFGFTAAAGEGITVLAFRTGSGNTLDLDVTVGPVNGVRVGGDHNLGVFNLDGFEWIAAYEDPSPSPRGAPSMRSTASSSHQLSPSKVNPDKHDRELIPSSVAQELRALVTAIETVPQGNATTEALSPDQRAIEVTGANGTTGDYTVFYHSCTATETVVGSVQNGTLAGTDCFAFNLFSAEFTYGHYWVFPGSSGDTLDLELTSTDFDASLFLFGPDGNLVDANDDFGGTNSRLIVELPGDGNYIAFPGSYDSLAVGAYTLSIDFFVPGTAVVDYVEVTPEGITLSTVGSTTQLTAAAFDPFDNSIGGTTFSWSSLNDSIATVDPNGLVTAQGVGQATIVAAADGVEGYALVSVLDPGLGPVTSWTSISSGASDTLRSVWGTASDNIYAVGHNGTILRFDGTSWSAMTSGTSNRLRGVWGTSPSDVYAVGDVGTILHFDGTIWSAMTSGTNNLLRGIWGTSPDDVYAVGGVGTILHFDGGSWDPLSSGTSFELRGIWGTSASDVYAVGELGTILHFDGTSWSAMPSGTNDGPRSVWGTSSSDVYAVGQFGAILHFNGTSWSAMTSGTSNRLRGVWGTSPSDVYAVGEFGTILRFDGTSWSTMTSGTSFQLRGIWGTSDGEMFAAGEAGTILRGGRGAPVADPTTSQIGAGAQSITGNGTSTTTVTVQLKDPTGANMTAGGDTVALTTSQGTLSAVTDNANGTYGATLTSMSGENTAIISGTVNSADIADSAFVDFTWPGDLLVDGSFSHGDAAWTTTTATAAPSRTISDPLTPPGLAVLGADASGAGVVSDSGSILQTVVVPAGSNARLAIWWKVVTGESAITATAWDKMRLTMRDTTGALFLLRRADTVCDCTLSNKDADTVYTSTFWNLAPLAGQTYTLRLAYTADATLPTLFRVDNASAAPPLAAPSSTAGTTVRTEAGTIVRIEDELPLVPNPNGRRKPER